MQRFARRNGVVALLLLVAFVLALAPPALAAPKADPGIKVYVNGNKVSFPDEPPWIDTQAGRVLVPLRFVSEALDARVDWNAAARTVTVERGEVTVKLVIGQKAVTRNGKAITLDVAPFLTKKGRTLVPLRFVSEALGAKVDWRENERAVYITDDQALTVYTTPAGYGEWEKLSKEERLKRLTVAEELAQKAKPYAGQPWDKSGWKFEDSRMFTGIDQIMVLSSVNDLKPNGVNLTDLGPQDGAMVLLDLRVERDAVYLTAANNGNMRGGVTGAPTSPDMWLVEPGNFVRYQVGAPYNYLGNPFEHKYNFAYVMWGDDIPHMGWADGKEHHIDEFKGFLFEYGGRVVYIPNPAYKGGS